MDNCSHNGTRLFEAVLSFASAWVKNGFVESGFPGYVEDPNCLSFPWTMVDKITPGPDGGVALLLHEAGLENVQSAKTAIGTSIAAFVNAEESGTFVIEDAFPNGRPPLEKAGVIITDRETVDKVEKMKVCTCLNPLHTGLAVFGCLLSYTRISDAMKDEVLQKLASGIAAEGLRVVVDPKIISPHEFIDNVINVRLPNPFIPDTPQRIATDTSLKIPIRFGETLKAYADSDKLNANELRAIPLVLAGWLRYLLGVDDSGNKYEPSPDPILTGGNPISIGKCAKSVLLADGGGMASILSDPAIFGVDLIEVGVAGRVAEYFALMEGPGAVRKTLANVLMEKQK
jgi:fructuronate reductase